MTPVRIFYVLTLLLCACNGGNNNSLQGSIGDTHDLNFTNVSIVAQTGAINIIYTGTNDGVVAELSVITTGRTVAAGTTLDGNQFLSAVSVTRAVADPNDVFPTVTDGTLTFSSYSASAGGSTAGNFLVEFLGGGILQGDFSGTTRLGN